MGRECELGVGGCILRLIRREEWSKVSGEDGMGGNGCRICNEL
jgi:hypothetical protein